MGKTGYGWYRAEHKKTAWGILIPSALLVGIGELVSTNLSPGEPAAMGGIVLITVSSIIVALRLLDEHEREIAREQDVAEEKL
jgi:hypothetical protein